MISSSKTLSGLLFLIYLVCAMYPAHGQWVRSAHNQAFSQARAIGHDDAGNVFVAGSFSCNVIFGNDTLKNNSCGEQSLPPLTPIQLDGFLANYDQNGTPLWIQQYVGSSNNVFTINDIAVSGSGESYLTGTFWGEIDLGLGTILETDTTAFVMKVGADGTTAWVTTLDADQTNGESIALTNDALYIAGYVGGDFSVAGNINTVENTQGFVAALDLDGNAIWMKNIFHGESSASSYAKSVTAAGDSLWVFYQFQDSVVLQPNDTIIQHPTLTEAGVLVHYDNIGTIYDYKITNSPYLIEDMVAYLPDSSIYLTGRSEGITAIGIDTLFTTVGNRAFVTSLDLASRDKWTIPITSTLTTNLSGTSIHVNTDSHIIAGGFFEGSVVNSPNHSSSGGNGINGFVVKLDSAGVDEWIQQLGGPRMDKVLSVSSLDDNHIYGSGYYDEYIRVGGDELTNPTNSSKRNGFWARLDICPQVIANMITADTVFVCEGQSTPFTVTNNTNYTYQWYKDNVALPATDNPILNVSEEGNYRAAIIDGVSGCSKLTPIAFLGLNPLPKNDISTNRSTQLCERDTVTLIGPSPDYSFQWYLNGTVIVGEQDRNTKATEAGDYHVRMTDSNNCVNTSAMITVEVLPYPSRNLSPTTDQVICAGAEVIIQADNTQVGMQYIWRNDDDVIMGEASSTLEIGVDGLFSALIKNAFGCTVESDTVTVSVQPAPVVGLDLTTAKDEICEGEVSLLITPNIIGQSYQWNKNGAAIVGATTNLLSVTEAGTYEVYVDNGICDKTSEPFTVVLHSLPIAEIINHDSREICLGDDYALEASPVDNSSYQWYRNGNALSGANGIALSVPISGRYTVKITDENACSALSSETQITVQLPPPAILSAQGETTFCEGQSVVLFAQGGSGLTYQWYKDGMEWIGVTDISVLVTDAGTYQVGVTNDKNCTAFSNERTIEVVTIPDAVLFSEQNLTSVCDRDSLLLLAEVQPGYEYNWLRNQTLINQASNNNYYAKEPGNYQVIATVGACRDTSSVLSLTLKPNPLPVITRNDVFISIALFGEIQWFIDDVPISGATQQVISVTESGAYTVSVRNGEGCISQSEPLSLCMPLAAIQKFEDVLTVNKAGDAYSWTYTNIPIEGADQRVLTAQQPGVYTAIVTDESGCTMETSPVTVCLPFPTIAQDPVTGVLLGYPHPALEFQWFKEKSDLTFGVLPDANTQVHIPDGPGVFKVKVTDLEGCTSFSESYTVDPVTGLVSFGEKAVRLFPNPMIHQLHIEQPFHQGETPVILYSSEGKEILRTFSESSISIINVRELHSGNYVLQLGEGDLAHFYKLTKR